MKGEMSKPRANLTDSKLSVRIGSRKFIKALKLPMRPRPSLTAIGFLMKQLRKQFRAKYPNIASPVDLHSAALVEWETMSDADKAPYAAMAEESFKLYSKRLKEYTETFMVCTDCLVAYWDKKSQHSTMKGEESKPRASRTDSKLSVRNGGGKAAKGPIRPSMPPFALGDMDFFMYVWRDKLHHYSLSHIISILAKGPMRPPPASGFEEGIEVSQCSTVKVG